MYCHIVSAILWKLTIYIIYCSISYVMIVYKRYDWINFTVRWVGFTFMRIFFLNFDMQVCVKPFLNQFNNFLYTFLLKYLFKHKVKWYFFSRISIVYDYR